MKVGGRWLVPVAGALLATACASRPPVLPAEVPQANSIIELADTAFYPQSQYQCGPAALATVLTAAGVATRPEALVDQVYLPGRRGSLQAELLAATRRAGRIPYEITPTLDALWAELAAGRPVLVLQNLGLDVLPVWHYAVVIGMNPANDSVILRSGVEPRRRERAADFLLSWRMAGNWAMVVLAPGELPAQGPLGRVLRAVALAEPVLPVDARQQAYRAVLDRWPASVTARFGYAHALHAAGDLAAAEAAYRAIIDVQPRRVASLNNLAEVLADRGCLADAEIVAQRAVAIARETGSALTARVRETLRGIRARAGDATACQ